MASFSQARQSMVESQIHPMGVVSEPILKAFQEVPRELFVPESLSGVAYVDEELEIAKGRYLLEPQVHARLLQALNLKSSDTVLDIAGGSGYSAAILSSLVAKVYALDSSADLLAKARSAWSTLEIGNIFAEEAPMAQGFSHFAPYDAIFIGGAVSKVPQAVLNQLKNGGKLVTVIQAAANGCGSATLFERVDEHTFGQRPLFETNTPFIPGFEPVRAFQL